MPRLNVDIPEDLYRRLLAERRRQDRSQRAIASIALQRYFLDLDRERDLGAAVTEEVPTLKESAA